MLKAATLRDLDLNFLVVLPKLALHSTSVLLLWGIAVADTMIAVVSAEDALSRVRNLREIRIVRSFDMI